jgi:hypothetical protein
MRDVTGQGKAGDDGSLVENGGFVTWSGVSILFSGTPSSRAGHVVFDDIQAVPIRFTSGEFSLPFWSFWHSGEELCPNVCSVRFSS